MSYFAAATALMKAGALKGRALKGENSAMTHIAVQERLDEKVVDWMEQVTEEQYRQ